MKRDTIQKSKREENRARKEHLQRQSRDNYWQHFFFCASKIAFTHSAKKLGEENKKRAIKHKYDQIYTLRDNLSMFRQVCCFGEGGATSTCWIVTDSFSSLIQKSTLT